MEMNRRTFLKTTAVAAVAVSLSGVLAGCSGGDSGTNLGGFTVKVGQWRVVAQDEGIGAGLSWHADFKINVSAHNLDSENAIGIPGESAFTLTINGEDIALQPGGLLSNTTLALKKGERKSDILTFRLTDAQENLYAAMKAQTADIKLTVGIKRHETYTGSYDGFTFVKDTTV